MCASICSARARRARACTERPFRIDPLTLPTPEEVSAAIVPLCLPECTENGRLYDFRAKKFLEFSACADPEAMELFRRAARFPARSLRFPP